MVHKVSVLHQQLFGTVCQIMYTLMTLLGPVKSFLRLTLAVDNLFVNWRYCIFIFVRLFIRQCL